MIEEMAKDRNNVESRVKEAYEKGLITEAEIRLSARRILNMILKID